jgi:hypothetical protein
MLDGTQPAPEGESVANAGNESVTENTNVELNTSASEGDEGGEEQQHNEGGEQTTEEEQKPKKLKFNDLPKWATARINEETNRRRTAEDRLRELEAQMAQRPATQESEERQNPTQTQQPQNTDTDLDRRASQLLDQREYDRRVNEWASAGHKEYAGDFDDRCNFLAGMGAGVDFMKIVTDPEIVTNGHRLVAELADEPEEAQRILRLPPAKMAVALAKFSDKLANPPAPAPKPISKVPAPVNPVGGSAQAATTLDDPDMPMDKFADKFLADLGKKRR